MTKALRFAVMGYYYRKKHSRDKPGGIYATHKCNHEMYDSCTLFKIGELGLAVVQQKYNEDLKCTWWGPLEAGLAEDIVNEPLFYDIFYVHAGRSYHDDIYPSMSVRRLMRELKMKPLPKPSWEKGVIQ